MLFRSAFMERLYAHTARILDSEDAFIIGGDYNIAPTDRDVYDPDRWRTDALCRPESRAALRKLLYLGLTDAIDVLGKEKGRYTWWDYKAGAWARDQGLRIDHLLLSPQAADRLNDSGIDRSPRGKEKPSDHTPVWCQLAD